MQAVILAAGRGTRMQALTDALPKPLLAVGGKSLIELKLEALPDAVTEVIMVVGYQGDLIRARFGDSFGGRTVRYVEQDTLDGTAGALWRARDLLSDRFLVMMGDDLYARTDIETCLAVPDWGVLVEKTETMGSGGRMVMDDAGHIVAIEEGDHRGKPGLMNTNLLALDPRLFERPMVPKTAGSGEYGLPQTVLATSLALGIPLVAVPATGWIQVTAPEDLTRAERLLGVEGVGSL